MPARPASPVSRLLAVATMIAAVAACMVGFIVMELSRDAASDDIVLGPMLGFTGSCFVLAWLLAFLVGWLMLRRRGGRAE